VDESPQATVPDRAGGLLGLKSSELRLDLRGDGARRAGLAGELPRARPTLAPGHMP
jgi:hypothetical protein